VVVQVSELVRDHDRDLAGRKALDERVPEHDPAARAEPGRLGVRERRDVVNGLHDDRHVSDVLDPLQPRRRGPELRALQPVCREKVRIDEREKQREPDEAGAPANHQRRSRRAKPITIASARQKTNCPPSASQLPKMY
jgi:hypothetical protein